MKKVILLRSLPGAGKSTLSKQLLLEACDKYGSVLRLETDAHYRKDGEYRFDGTQVLDARNRVCEALRQALDAGVELIIIDDVHIQLWEMLDYIIPALRAGYAVQFAEPDTEWKFDVNELSRRNIHGVPRHAIALMFKMWDSTVDIIAWLEDRLDIDVNRAETTIWLKSAKTG